MILGHFHGFVGAKAVRASGYHSNLVVEALDGGAGKLSFGPEPVHQQLFMIA
jgi:hypothetical protein